jgi:hypothetical protein
MMMMIADCVFLKLDCDYLSQNRFMFVVPEREHFTEHHPRDFKGDTVAEGHYDDETQGQPRDLILLRSTGS